MQGARSSPPDGSDEDYIPGPASPKRKKSPNADKSYSPSKESLERQESDENMPPDRRAKSRSRSASSKGSPRPKARQEEYDSGSEGSSHNDDKENAMVGPQDQNEDQDTVMQDQDDNQESNEQQNDTDNDNDREVIDTDSQSVAHQQEEYDSDVDSQTSASDASDASSARTGDNGNQTPTSRQFYPNGQKIPSDRLRKRALFQNLKTQYPGYTTAELKSAMKRPLQDGDKVEAEGSTPRTSKRVRIAAGDESRPASYLDEPLKDIFDRILIIPESLNLAEIGACFTELQDLSLEFAQRFFSFKLSDAQIKAWPLHLLKWDYFGLKTTAQWLADGDIYGWREFFTSPESRVALVHAIIGEFLKEHVFKQTAFSFTGHNLRKLQELDEKYLKYDAFVRNKKRAALLNKIICETHGFWLAHREYMLDASGSLARMILELLEPLMPHPLFNPLLSFRCLLEPKSPLPFQKDTISQAERQHAKELWDYMIHDLRVLIYKAASVHLSIRLSGHDGTNIRILRPIEKGTTFTQTETMECINQADCDAGIPEPFSDDNEVQIKMTCWGQVEAVVPHGVDLEQYEQIEAQFYAQTGEDDPRSFDSLEAYFKENLPVLPAEIREDAESDELNAGPRHPGTEWDHEMAQFEAQQRQEEKENNRQQARRHGTPGQEDVNPFHLPQRGSYVTYYKCVVRSQVYCEWTKKGRQIQSLDEAVERARLGAGVYYKLEDSFINMTNATMRLIERSGLHQHWHEALWYTLAIAGIPLGWKLGRSRHMAWLRVAMYHAANAMPSPENAREALMYLRARVLERLLALRATNGILQPSASQGTVLEAATLPPPVVRRSV